MKVLVAETDKLLRDMVVQTLAQMGYRDVVTAADTEQVHFLLRQNDGPDMAIIDFNLPGENIVRLCEKIRCLENRPYVYTILLAHEPNMPSVWDSVEVGADDYLIKPLEHRELVVRLRAAKRIFDLQAQLITAHKAVEFQVAHDSLTHLLSREAILDLLNRELARSKREATPLSVAMADIDHFKQVNDLHGHLVGDAVLREASARMKSSVRIYDGIGRYGGEEFLIVMPGCTMDNAIMVTERIRSSLCETPVEVTELQVQLNLSVSIGLTTMETPRVLSGEDMIRVADAALYEAKRKGRNRIATRPLMENVSS
ncbi:MAG: diguanylate cyclase [Planctomycetota bacterium]|nr:diguanylate cyclase [Planctomycetota bacterium]MDA1141227.1 diguanylate cyclase [Planctomycetota bacterium]